MSVAREGDKNLINIPRLNSAMHKYILKKVALGNFLSYIYKRMQDFREWNAYACRRRDWLTNISSCNSYNVQQEVRNRQAAH